MIEPNGVDESYGTVNSKFQDFEHSLRKGYENLRSEILRIIDLHQEELRDLQNIALSLANALIASSETASSRVDLLNSIKAGDNEAYKQLLNDDRALFDLIAERSGESIGSNNISEINLALGDEFDPVLHDNRDEPPVPSSFDAGTICKVLRKGYVLTTKSNRQFVIRPAYVEISSGKIPRIKKG